MEALKYNYEPKQDTCLTSYNKKSSNADFEYLIIDKVKFKENTSESIDNSSPSKKSDEFNSESEELISKKVVTLRWSKPKSRLEVLQKFEGTVIDVSEDKYKVEVRDLTSDEFILEEGYLHREEISPSDLPLVKQGAIFYWIIGYRTTSSGQRTRVSWIRFQRLPVWTEAELKDAEEEARYIAEKLRCKSDR